MSIKTLQKIASVHIVYKSALLNSALFLTLSVIQNYIIQVEILPWILLPNIIFLISSVIIWGLMMQRGWCLAPISWFVLGSGLFFGFGVIAGGLHVHSWSAELYGDDTSYLLQVNLLNSVSVFIVLLVALFFIGSKKKPMERGDLDFEVKYKRIILTFSLFTILILSLRFFFFPGAASLIIGSLLAKVYFFIPAAFLILGFITRKIGVSFFILSGAMFIQIVYGVLQLNKYEILMPFLALLVGSLAHFSSFKKPVTIVVLMLITFWVANPLISIGRLDYRYNSATNSFSQRVAIISDVIKAAYVNKSANIKHVIPAGYGGNPVPEKLSEINVVQRMNLLERFRAIGIRFDVASIQGYLINEYQIGRTGDSMNQFWGVIVPRVVWPNKPIVTRFGGELNAQYYNSAGQASSSIAPTYNAEAYWNFGWLGVLLISAYLGLVFGFFSRLGLSASQDANISYLLVAYQLLFPALFVESWVVSTYIGGLIIVFAYYFMIKFFLDYCKKYNSSKYSEIKDGY